MKNRDILIIMVLSFICFIGLSSVGKVAEAKKKNEDKDYWCKKATELKRSIDKARDEVKNEEDKLEKAKSNRQNLSYKKQKSYEQRLGVHENKVEKAKIRLKYAERELQDLEDEAHRKNVPPGWLRCQFTY